MVVHFCRRIHFLDKGFSHISRKFIFSIFFIINFFFIISAFLVIFIINITLFFRLKGFNSVRICNLLRHSLGNMHMTIRRRSVDDLLGEGWDWNYFSMINVITFFITSQNQSKQTRIRHKCWLLVPSDTINQLIKKELSKIEYIVAYHGAILCSKSFN